MPVCLHWRRGLQAGSRVRSPGFRGLSFWSRFLSVRCLGSGELLMSADRVRHSVSRKKKGAFVAISTHAHAHTQTHHASTYTHAYMHFSMLHTMETCLLTSEKKNKLSKSRASSKWLLFASFLSVCVSKWGILGLISLQILPNPFSLGPLSSYLLPSSFFKQPGSTVLSISISSLYFGSLLISVLCFFFLFFFFNSLPPPSPSSISLSLHHPASVVPLYFQVFKFIWQMGKLQRKDGVKFKKLMHRDLCGCFPVVIEVL